MWQVPVNLMINLRSHFTADKGKLFKGSILLTREIHQAEDPVKSSFARLCIAPANTYKQMIKGRREKKPLK